MTATLESTTAPVGVITKDLLGAVQKAVKVINVNTTVPILSNVLLEADGTNLSVTATDLEVRVKSTVPCNGGSFRTTVVGKQFLQMLKGAGDAVSLDHVPAAKPAVEYKDGVKVYNGEGGSDRLVVTSDYGEVELFTLPADEYPPAPGETESYQPLNPEANVTCKGAELAKAFSRIAIFASNDEYRGAVLMGTLVEFQKQEITITATDGYKLGQVVVPGGASFPPGGYQAIVPARALVLAAKGLNKKTEATLSVGERFATIESDSTVWTVRTVDGQYPNYRIVIPEKYDRSALIPTKPFLTAAASAEKVAGDRASTVKFAFERGSGLDAAVQISSSSDISGRFEAQVPLKHWVGDDVTISFNAKYLLDVIKKGFPDATDTIRIELLSGLSPVKISSPADHGADFAVLMPLRQ